MMSSGPTASTAALCGFLLFAGCISQRPIITPSDHNGFRFVVLADSRGNEGGINQSVVDSILADIKKLNPQPAFAVIPGDLVVGSPRSGDLKRQLLHFRNTITKYYPIDFYYLGIGNHEIMHDNRGESIFSDVFPEPRGQYLGGYHRSVYWFDRGATRLFMLNSDHPSEMHRISNRQLAWIKRNADPSKQHSIFFMHEPSYPTGYYIGSALDSDPYKRNKLWDLIDSMQGPLVFCGHEHFYSRRHIDRCYNETINGKSFSYDRVVYQVTVGGFGGPLLSNFVDKPGVDVPPIAAHHFAVVDIDENGIRVTALGLGGTVLDKFQVGDGNLSEEQTAPMDPGKSAE